MSSERRKYRTEVPNIIDDAGLSVYAFRLYAHIRRVTGESGTCTQGTRTMAQICVMSVGRVSTAKKELLDVGLIRIKKISTLSGRGDEITVVDIWDENRDLYARRVFTDEQSSVHASSFERSSHERKKQLLEEQTNKEGTKLAMLVSRATSNLNRTRKGARRTPIPDDFQVSNVMRKWAAKEAPLFDTVAVDLETQSFICHAQADDLRSSNWVGFWYAWMRKQHQALERRNKQRKALR